MGPGDKHSCSHPLYSPGSCVCCSKSIISGTCTSFHHSDTNRVFPSSSSTFSSHKGGATTHPKGSIRNMKVYPGSSDPPGRWKSWEENLQSKSCEFTPDQIVTVMTQNQLKIDRTMARILKMFYQYSTLRLVAVVGHFEH